MHFGRVPAQRRFTLCRSVVNILLALADKYIAIKFLFFGTLKGWWFVLWLAFFLVRHLLHSSSSVFWLSDFQPQWNLILPFTLKWLDWPRQYYLFRASPLRNFIAYWQKKRYIFVLLHLKSNSCTSRTWLQLVLEYLGVAEKEGARNDKLSGAIWLGDIYSSWKFARWNLFFASMLTVKENQKENQSLQSEINGHHPCLRAILNPL